eukprot:8161955-Alexandrium_andersonii.AAC.1
MSASLVGSEMCIRDSRWTRRSHFIQKPSSPALHFRKRDPKSPTRGAGRESIPKQTMNDDGTPSVLLGAHPSGKPTRHTSQRRDNLMYRMRTVARKDKPSQA